ncbi:MAG: hypothetical protein J5726_10260 [Treponema sp.]|nr:hypothetical protein [Treponema sp.]
MKKMMAVIAALAVALTLVGCNFGDNKGLGAKAAGTKKNMTVIASNDGTDGKLYQRGWKQLGTKETVQALETTITIDMSTVAGYAKKSGTGDDIVWSAGTADDYDKQVAVVIGLIFDLHETKLTADDAETGMKKGSYYDFVLIGYQPETVSYYIERYENVPKGLFAEASNAGSFTGLANYVKATGITDTVGDGKAAYYTPNAAGKQAIAKATTGKLPKSEEDGDNGGTTDVTLQTITVKITQDTKGTYNINLGDMDWPYTPAVNKDWVNKDGYRIGGAGYYINCPVGLSAKANYNSKNDNTIGLIADEEF